MKLMGQQICTQEMEWAGQIVILIFVSLYSIKYLEFDYHLIIESLFGCNSLKTPIFLN